jgi:tryptophan synthase alpha subunit
MLKPAADGVIVGSAIVRRVEKGTVEEVGDLVQSLAAALA